MKNHKPQIFMCFSGTEFSPTTLICRKHPFRFPAKSPVAITMRPYFFTPHTMTDRYAVIGNPIAHSKSPLIHTLFAQQTGEDLHYEALFSPLDGFVETVRTFQAQGGKGMNITVPFKFEAFDFASKLTERARLAGAVNTLSFLPNGDVLGDNTDGAGLVRDITVQLGFDLRNKRVLLLGAGGAAFGVVLPLLAAGAVLTVANRTVDKAAQLAATFNTADSPFDPVVACGYAELSAQAFDCVVNATSSGLSDQLPPIPAEVFGQNSLAYDMMYGRDTPFMTFAHQHGAQVADGLGMLVEQAAEAFFVWRGIRPDTTTVRKALR
jgi:shikimate dehydrogenase